MFRKISSIYRSPKQVQNLLRAFAYNHETNGETVRSAKTAYELREAHCLEAALLAAAILEHRGYPPLLLSLDSKDHLNHIVFLFRGPKGWGTVGRSREPGLHGRSPQFRSIRDLAWSYFDPFIDKTGLIIGYQVYDLRNTTIDWRFSKRHVRKMEKILVELPHRKMDSSRVRHQRVRSRYLANGPLPLQHGWW